MSAADQSRPGIRTVQISDGAVRWCPHQGATGDPGRRPVPPVAEPRQGGRAVRRRAPRLPALRPNEPFDAVISFDTVHDLPDSDAFLRAVHRLLAPGGHYLMTEPRASSNLGDNIGHPSAPLLYAVSTLHCLTVSLAEGSAGLGTAFGEQKAIALFTEAGFTGITVTPTPGDPMGGVFVATKPAA